MSVFSNAPEVLETERLILRPPRPGDADAIFERYASDAAVTRYLSWPRHRSLDETRAFVASSEAEWERWPVGPYLVLARDGGRLLGGTGLRFETRDRAEVGYVLARDAWGRGYASEALAAMVDLASRLGVRRLYALCHPDHRPSWRVLEKGGFAREDLMRRGFELPNLVPGEYVDLLCYSLTPPSGG